MKKILSIVLAAVLLVPVFVLPAYAYKSNDYIITNPYENIDWESWKGYKTQLHCHTTASDGYQTITEAISDYYALDYDIVAITDHGTINRGWSTAPDTIPIVRAIKKERTGGANSPIIPLSTDEYIGYTSGNAQSKEFTFEKDGETIRTGITRTHTNGMLDVEKGNELNMATPVADCHLTGYWSEYGQGLAGVFGDYETPTEGVKAAGGISMLAHIGEYVYTDKDSADHVGQRVDE